MEIKHVMKHVVIVLDIFKSKCHVHFRNQLMCLTTDD